MNFLIVFYMHILKNLYKVVKFFQKWNDDQNCWYSKNLWLKITRLNKLNNIYRYKIYKLLCIILYKIYKLFDIDIIAIVYCVISIIITSMILLYSKNISESAYIESDHYLSPFSSPYIPSELFLSATLKEI